MKAKDLAYIALCTALIIICSWITVPIPAMQFTLQVFAVAFAAYFLGIKGAVFSVIAFLLLGLVGVPVFSNFNAGVGAFAGPTGGFLVGFIPFAVIISLFSSVGKKSVVNQVIGGFLGHLSLYSVGNVWFVFVQGFTSADEFFTKLWAVIILMIPYFLIDVIKIIGALFLARLLKRVLNYN